MGVRHKHILGISTHAFKLISASPVDCGMDEDELEPDAAFSQKFAVSLTEQFCDDDV